MEMEKFSDSLPFHTNDIENPVLQDSLKSLKQLNNKDLNILDWGNNRIAIPIEISIDLPNLGNFKNLDIRQIEPIILVFDLNNYPVSAPKVYSDRLDFPKNNLAHLYVAVDNRPPAFCYVRGNADEWYANKRIEDLVIRISNWLRDAATGELTENGEQYEPLRLEGYSGSIIYDYDTILSVINSSVATHFGKRLAIALFEHSNTEDQNTYKFTKLITDKNALTTIKEVDEERKKGKEDVTKKKYYFTYILWNDESDIKSEYEVNIPSSWTGFISFCKFYNIEYKEFEKFITTFSDINDNIYFPVIIGIHRPKQLIGYSSNIEFVNLRFRMYSDDLKDEKIVNDIPISMLMHSQPLTHKLASKISGYDIINHDRSAVFGCGAIGSKIIMHLAKAGQTNLTLIDPDLVSPHNLVRHSLFADDIGKNKADALSEKIKKMFPFELPNVISGPSFKEGLIDKKETFDYYSWVLDFTASDAFFNKLVTLKSLHDCNVASASITNFGNLGIMYKEGESRNPRIDDLQVHLYSLSENNKIIQNWLIEEQLTINSNNLLVQVGVGCNSETTILSDDKISSHASYFSGGLKKEMFKNSKKGKIYLNQITEEKEDYLIQNQVITVNPFKVYQAVNDPSWEIRFKSEIVEDLMLKFKKNKDETGGVFIGVCNYKTKTIHITGIIIAPPDSKANHFQFIRGHAGLSDKISNIESKSGGQIGYIGEWHTHPNGPNFLSDQDMSSVENHKKECSNLLPPLPVFLTIVTPNGLFPYVF